MPDFTIDTLECHVCKTKYRKFSLGKKHVFATCEKCKRSRIGVGLKMKQDFDIKTDLMTVEKLCKKCGNKYKMTGNLQSVAKRRLCKNCILENSRECSRRHIAKNKEYYREKNRQRRKKI